MQAPKSSIPTIVMSAPPMWLLENYLIHFIHGHSLFTER